MIEGNDDRPINGNHRWILKESYENVSKVLDTLRNVEQGIRKIPHGLYRRIADQHLRASITIVEQLSVDLWGSLDLHDSTHLHQKRQ